MYPGFVKLDDYIKGLKLIWEHRVEGWWNQQDDLVKYGVCTTDEYLEALRVTVEQRKNRP